MYLIRLLSWTTSLDLLIDLTILRTFWLFHENLALTVFMFFIQCTLPDLTGKWFFHKQKHSIFFQGLCKPLLWLKFYPDTVTSTPTSTFLTEIFGWTDYTLKYQIHLKKMPDNWHGTWNKLGHRNLELLPKITKSKFIILITIKKTERFIGFWPLETSISRWNKFFYCKFNRQVK